MLQYVQRRVQDAGDAEEIATETFAVAWTKPTSSDVSLPWLFVTARNKIKAYHRQSARRRAVEDRVGDEAMTAAAGLSQIDRLSVRDAVASLTRREREVIMLTYWEQLPADEVAEVLGCAAGSVWTALSRGRAKLRKILGDDVPAEAGVNDG